MLNKFLNVNRITRGLVPFTVIVMEALWIYPWLVMMGRWPILTEQRLPMNLAGAVFLLSHGFILTRLVAKWELPLARRRWALTGFGLFAILLVLRIEYPAGAAVFDLGWFIDIGRLMVASFMRPHPAVLSVFIGFFLWWQGIMLGYSPFHFDNVYRYFTIGLLAQVILIIAWGVGSPGESMSAIGLYVAGFFAAGLSALALARIQAMQSRARDSEAVTGISRRWFATIAIVTGSVILVGIGIASIFSPAFLSGLGKLINVVSGALFRVFFYVLSIFLQIVGFFIAVSLYIVQAIINALQGEVPAEVSSSGNITAFQQFQEGVSRNMSSETVLILKWVIFGVLLAAAIFLIARAIMRYGSGRRRDDIEEESESLWSWEGFISDVRQFFKPRLKTGKAPRAFVPGRRKGRLSIREIYQLLLWHASRLGVARHDHETPYEYGKRLGRAVPEGSQPLGELTDIYIGARYSGIAAGEKETDYANGLWAAIEQLLRGRETNPK